MTDTQRVQAGYKGPWTHRVLVMLFTFVLGIVIYWLLGFAIDDLGSWAGPSYAELEEQRLDPSFLSILDQLNSQITDTKADIADQKLRQTFLRDSTRNSRETMSQLLELQRLSLQQGATPSSEEQQVLAESERLFLANQQQYQQLSGQILQLNQDLRDLEGRRRENTLRLIEARKPIREEHNTLVRRHRLFMAVLKVGLLVPLLGIAVGLFIKLRSGAYAQIVYAFGGAVLLRTIMVVHEYFPARYFKYVLIVVVLLVVGRILIHLLRMVAFPRADWHIKRYRGAYASFMCPICRYPMRRGPLRYLSWTRRSLRKQSVPLPEQSAENEPYTCPACGTRLFEKCESCGAIRHSLLPSCERCGDTISVPAS